MKRTHLLLGLMFPLASIAAEAPAPSRIDILSDAAHPVANVAAVQAQLGRATVIRYFAIDAQPRLEESLSKDLPANPEQARAIALQRIQALDRSTLEKELSESVEGLLLAQRYRITRYPAVVFDEGKSVVYGVTDLREAMRLYQQSVIRKR
jgi:integrating conjugative element protein (TIGR03757 family)